MVLYVTAAAGASFTQQAPDSTKILRAAQNAAYDGATRRRFYEREARRPPSRRESRQQFLLRYLDFAAERREPAIRRLDEYALELPGDDWITGHRIGLRIRQGRTAEAAAIAAECRASKWWCDALLGVTHHLQDRILEADQAFASALSAMPEDERCAWLDDLSLILTGDLRRAWDEADCTRRIQMQQRLWWLADPLHIREGNERRTEQLFRAVTMRLHHDELAIVGGECHDEHHMRHLQAGWGPWWWEAGMGFSTNDVQNLWDSRGFRFFPTDGAWLGPVASAEDDWAPSFVDTGERYRPSFGSLSALPHQTAFFARGDSLLVLAAAEPAGPVSVAGVALSRNEHEPAIITHETNVTGTARLKLRVPRDAWLVSVEAIGGRGAFRSRFGHRLPDATAGGLALSDLLLFEWQDGLEESLEAVEPRMLGSTTLTGSRDIGVFWETYGVTDRSALNVSLTVRGLDSGLFRRLGEALG
ncbi:MAG TPA: hypothetical protein VMM17_09180, partial [Gemmatimonadaceae bacterium]|nr:hypothetical protein [Gemmatimonadaceae bacterium]